jgi:ATP-binding cassette subfamily F protein 3
MISLDKLSVYFGGTPLFKDISFLITRKDHIGLVGKNGAGKSTILKLIEGILEPSEGTVSRASDITTGYLPQQMTYSDTKSVRKEVADSFTEIKDTEAQIQRITNEIANRTDYESDAYLKLLDRLNFFTERQQILGGDKVDERIEKILLGLGFENSDFEKPTNTFSGGWRMRIELAKVLLRNPDVLLLDEPTNHLDIESIQWLEEFLTSYNGAIVLISHDRAFLDAITNRTIEISMGQIYDYPVSYSKFVHLRKERREQQLAAYKNQQKMIEDTERFIERFRYQATKAVQVQQRIKQLEKLDRIEIDEEDNAAINISFPPAPRAGSIVVETEGLTKSYGPKEVLKNIDLVVERGEKIAFVGKNGEGKTTLSRIITGELEFEGKLKLGHNVKIGYFAQNQDTTLDESKTVFSTIDDIATGDVRTKIRDILGAFLFRGEDIDKKVSVLSGGERSRLAIAKLLLEPYNLLVMDEPTNHLDITSKDILKKALNDFDGTIILVSHDREFLSGLTEKIYEFRAKKVYEFRGDIFDFLKKKKIESLNELQNAKKTSQTKKEDTPSHNKLAYEEMKKLDREIRKTETKIEKTETEITLLEEKIEEYDRILANPDNAQEQLNDKNFHQDYSLMKEKLIEAMTSWEDLQLKAEELKNLRYS